MRGVAWQGERGKKVAKGMGVNRKIPSCTEDAKYNRWKSKGKETNTTKVRSEKPKTKQNRNEQIQGVPPNAISQRKRSKVKMLRKAKQKSD